MFGVDKMNKDIEYIEEDYLYKEACFMADIYGIPQIVVDDTYEMFLQFVREELKHRIKTGMPTQKIFPETYMTFLMSQANVG